VAFAVVLDEIGPDAAVIGAVNTVRREGGRLIGENTDGKGFLGGVRLDAGLDPRGIRAIVLGAGGAARAIVTELALAGVWDIEVVNRSVERGERMVAEIAEKTKTPISFTPWRGTYRIPKDADLVVNATSIGLYLDADACRPWSSGESTRKCWFRTCSIRRKRGCSPLRANWACRCSTVYRCSCTRE